MPAHHLVSIINQIRSDKDYLEERRVFHENYEWLEYFWRTKYNREDNSIDDFINEKANFYWNTSEIKETASQFASIECVGSNKKTDYTQNEEIAKATMYLRFHCNLFPSGGSTCSSIGCRPHKLSTGLCMSVNGRRWNKKDNDSQGSFKALMYIIRQVRNNMFHGHKMTLEPNQYKRDKILIRLCADATAFLIQELINSGS